MDEVLLGLDEAVCTRQGLLWTLTSTALRNLHAHARNFPTHLHLIQKYRCVSRPLYQVGCTQSNLHALQLHANLNMGIFNYICSQLVYMWMFRGSNFTDAHWNQKLFKKYIARLQLDRLCGDSPDIPGQNCRKTYVCFF